MKVPVQRSGVMAAAGGTVRPHVVVVGAGFGGLAAAKALADAPLDVTVIDRRNYHLFQPLLYQVATAGLSPADIAWPIRSILNRERNVEVLLEDVTGVDTARREVVCSDRRVPYDYLILATGARHAYFGHDDWEPFAPGLKKIDDATAIRRRLLSAFERAEVAADPVEQERLLTFVVVGAGPTGVEMAGAMVELAHKALAKDFRHVNPRDARILLLEAGPRVLGAFPETLSRYAKRALERLGVEVRLNQPVTAVDANGVGVGGERIHAATVVWAAGVKASPAAKWLGVAADRAGRIEVEPDLSVPGHSEIFVIGDVASATYKHGPVPGIAPAAKQEGHYAARVVRARAAGEAVPPPFVYHHQGNLATIGRHRAVIDFGWIRLRGWPAWWLWGFAHIYFLIGVRAPALVAIQWLWSYVTFGKGARLITGAEKDD
jgi:NADH:quinone reductase (non-electrogenic)